MKKRRIDEIEYSENTDNDVQDRLSAEELRAIKESISNTRVDRSKLPPHDRSVKARVSRYLKKHVVLAVISVILALSILSGAGFGTVMLGIGFVENVIKPNADFIIVIGDNDPYKVKMKDAVRDGILYIDLRKIAEVTGLKMSGTEKRIQFSTNNNTYMLFEDKSDVVYINGRLAYMEAKSFDGNRRSSAKAYVTADQCLVPYEFLVNTISADTLRFELDKENHTILIKPKYTAVKGDAESKKMKEILFITDNIDAKRIRQDYKYTYTVNVNDYLTSIKSEHLLLVNKNNLLGSTFVPDRLTNLTVATDGRTHQLQYDAARALEIMIKAMEADGITGIYVTSAYRSYKYQENLYWGYVNDHMNNEGLTEEEAMEKASTYSARPGESEHQTGLCIDFSSKSLGGKLNENFEKLEAFEWLSKNAHKYGFILRYPKDKTEVTKYDYEPWHYRFVGRQAATDMYYWDMCLEEYIEEIK